jgi:predicted nucleic acid-binding protein
MPLSTAHAWLRHELFVAEESAIPEVQWPTVYVDTSVVSYLTARLNRSILIARRQRLTRVWWHRYRRRHTLLISDLVLAEAADGDTEAAEERRQALLGIVALPINPKSRSLAKQLIGGAGLPISAGADAEHIAVSAINSVRLLLTWNCKHLANPFIRKAVVHACETNGVRCPEICTPEQLMRTYAYERPIA